MRRIFHLLCALTLALGAAGCAVSPSPSPIIDSPTKWISKSYGEKSATLIRAEDPTLASLQTRALGVNRDIASAVLRWRASQRQIEFSELDRQAKPSLSAQASGSRSVQHNATWQRAVGLSAGVSYELDLWQRLSATQQAQIAQARASAADVAASRLLILSRVAEAYWNLAAINAQAPLLAERLRGQEQSLALTRLRVQEGKLLPIEVDKEGALLQSVQLQIAQQIEQQVQQQLLLGLLLADPEFEAPAARLPASSPPSWSADEGPEVVLNRRPDVQQARAQVDAALQRLRVSEAARYPNVSLGLNATTGGVSWKEWLQHPMASLTASLVIPMVDWRRLDLQRMDARGDLELAALQLRDTMHRALVEIEQQIAEQNRLKQEQDANTARLREATSAERLAALRLEVGQIGRLDWLQARNARLAAESESTQLALRRWLNQLALQRALADQSASAAVSGALNGQDSLAGEAGPIASVDHEPHRER